MPKDAFAIGCGDGLVWAREAYRDPLTPDSLDWIASMALHRSHAPKSKAIAPKRDLG